MFFQKCVTSLVKVGHFIADRTEQTSTVEQTSTEEQASTIERTSMIEQNTKVHEQYI